MPIVITLLAYGKVYSTFCTSDNNKTIAYYLCNIGIVAGDSIR